MADIPPPPLPTTTITSNSSTPGIDFIPPPPPPSTTTSSNNNSSTITVQPPTPTSEYIPPPPPPTSTPTSGTSTSGPTSETSTPTLTSTPISTIRRQRSASTVELDDPTKPSSAKSIPKPQTSHKPHPQHRVYKTLYFTGSRGSSPDISQQLCGSVHRYPTLQSRRLSTDIPPPAVLPQLGASSLSVGASYATSPGAASQGRGSPMSLDIPPPPPPPVDLYSEEADRARRDELMQMQVSKLKKARAVTIAAPNDDNYIPPPPISIAAQQQQSTSTSSASSSPMVRLKSEPLIQTPSSTPQLTQPHTPSAGPQRSRGYTVSLDDVIGRWSEYDAEYAEQKSRIKKELQMPEGPEFTMGIVAREPRQARGVVEVQGMGHAAASTYSEYTRPLTVCRPGEAARHGVALNTFGAFTTARKYEPPPSVAFAPLRVADPNALDGAAAVVARTPRRATVSEQGVAPPATAMAPSEQLTQGAVEAMVGEYLYPKVRLEVAMREAYHAQHEYDPLFFTVALYDTAQRARVSEDFEFQLNDRQTLQSLGLTALIPEERPITRAAFAVSAPSPTLYFVIKAFRIFHGDIDKDQAAILKSKTDPATHREDLKKIAASYAQVGSLPLQPYYWAATPVYTTGGSAANAGRSSLDYGSTPQQLQSASAASLPYPPPSSASSSSSSSSSGTSASSSSPNISFHLPMPFSTPSTPTPQGPAGGAGAGMGGGIGAGAGAGAGSVGGGNVISSVGGGSLQLVCNQRVENFMMIKGTLTDDMIMEHLCSEKMRRVKGTCGVALSFDVSESMNPSLTRISESQIPLVPFDPSKEFIKEVHPFLQDIVPHFECVNDLFVYPKHLVIKSPSPHSSIQISVQIIPESSFRAGAAVGRTKYVYPTLYTWQRDASIPSDSLDTPPALLGEAFSTIQADESHPEFCDEFKLQLPNSLADLCLLFTVYSVSYASGKFARCAIGHAGMSLSETGSGGGAVRHAGEYYLPVVKVLGELTARMMVPMAKATAKKSKSFLRIKLVPWSSIFPEDAQMANFLEAASAPDLGVSSGGGGGGGDPNKLRSALAGLENVESTMEMRFFLPMMRAFSRVVSCCDLGQALNAYRSLVTFLFKVFSTPGYQGKDSNSPLLRLYASVFFDPELFSRGGRPLHEGLVRAFQDMLKAGRAKTFQEHPQDTPFTWFILELITKSIAAHVCEGKALSDEFQWGVLDLVAGLLKLYKGTSMIHIRVSLRALGVFVNNLFPLLSDRGRLINILMSYLSTTDPENKNSITFNTLKLPLVQALADYEHLVPINRPMEFDPALFENVAALNSTFTALHPLIGEIIHEVCTAISTSTNRHTAIKTFRDLIRKHNADERYRSPELQADIALMYFPAVLNLMEHRPEIEALCVPSRGHSHGNAQGQGQGQQGPKQAGAAAAGNAATTASPQPPTSASLQEQAQGQQQQHELLTAYMWIVETCPAEAFRAWWRHDTEKRHIMFFDMLGFCLECFRGQDQLDTSIAAVARLCVDFAEDNTAALAAPGNPVFRCLFECLTTALSLARDRSVKVLIDTFRTLLTRIPQQFFSHTGNAYIDGLCTEVFRAVGEGRYNGTFVKPKEAAEFLFSMFQQNYDLTGDTLRMRTQAVLAISRLFVESNNNNNNNNNRNSKSSTQSGSAGAMGSAADSTSMDSISGYEVSDGEIDFDTLLSIVHAVQEKCVPGETVAAVTEGIEEVVAKASFLLECQRKIQRTTDPDALAEYYYQNTVSSAQNPDFRIIWLENLCFKHQETGNFEEAAHCKIFVALLIAKYLITMYHANLSEDDFALLTPDVGSILAQIDIRAAQDSGQFQTSAWTIDALILSLRQASECLARAQLYEHCLEVYSVITNILRKEKRYDDLSEVLREYTKTCDLIAKKEKERESRMISRFYRVRFYGKALDELDGRQYIYKRLPSVQIADMQTHLRNFLLGKVAGDQARVVLLPNRPVDEASLEPDKVYFQLASVEPYFDSAELEKRNTSYERTFGARRFIAVQAYTEDGKKSQASDLAEQKEKKTIYDAELAFPFVKNRIEIVSQREIILEPIQHALELIIGRCDKIKEQLENSPPKINPLQQVIQGSVVPMVNEGPVKICEVFLSEEAMEKNPKQDVENLSIAMGNFVELCAAAIQLNRGLITASQKKFTEMIEKYYKEMYDKISVYLEKTLDYKPKEVYSQDDLDRKLWREQKKVITDY